MNQSASGPALFYRTAHFHPRARQSDRNAMAADRGAPPVVCQVLQPGGRRLRSDRWHHLVGTGFRNLLRSTSHSNRPGSPALGQSGELRHYGRRRAHRRDSGSSRLPREQFLRRPRLHLVTWAGGSEHSIFRMVAALQDPSRLRIGRTASRHPDHGARHTGAAFRRWVGTPLSFGWDSSLSFSSGSRSRL